VNKTFKESPRLMKKNQRNLSNNENRPHFPFGNSSGGSGYESAGRNNNSRGSNDLSLEKMNKHLMRIAADCDNRKRLNDLHRSKNHDSISRKKTYGSGMGNRSH
jgi:hypothetical protein